MTAEPLVLDASVIVKCFLIEQDSDNARIAVAQRDDWIAPDLLFLEVASVAVKSLRRGLIDRTLADAMVAMSSRLVTTTVPSSALYKEAFRLAADHGFSPYDAAYLALAISHDRSVLTADGKLADRARNAGLGRFVRLLGAR